MPLLHTCECGHALRLKDEQLGKRLKCPRCAKIFSVGEKPPASKAAGRPGAADDADHADGSAPQKNEDEQQPKRRRKRKKARKGWFRLPAIAIDISFLGMSIWIWLAIILFLILGGLAAYHLVPGWGSQMYYSVEPFGQEAPSNLLGEMSKGLTVKIHNTPAGTIEHKLVTAHTIATLKTEKYDRRTALTVRGTAKGPSGEVPYEIDWTFDRGIWSVKCDGRVVRAAIWEHDTGQHQ